MRREVFPDASPIRLPSLSRCLPWRRRWSGDWRIWRDLCRKSRVLLRYDAPHMKTRWHVRLASAALLAVTVAAHQSARPVYATFGHSAASLDNPVAPAEDERDN